MQAFKEALKEAARLVLVSVIPVILMGINAEARTIHIDWFYVELIAIVTFLRFVDSWLHELGKKKNHKILKRGITGF